MWSTRLTSLPHFARLAAAMWSCGSGYECEDLHNQKRTFFEPVPALFPRPPMALSRSSAQLSAKFASAALTAVPRIPTAGLHQLSRPLGRIPSLCSKTMLGRPTEPAVQQMIESPELMLPLLSGGAGLSDMYVICQIYANGVPLAL